MSSLLRYRFLIALIALPLTLCAQNASFVPTATTPFSLSLRLGLNVGAAMPLPMPRSIRAVERYNPLLNFAVEGRLRYRFLTPDNTVQLWGLAVGLRLEHKGMSTEATVRNYFVNVIAEDGAALRGAFYGRVHTKMRLSLLSMPLLATWQPHQRWTFSAGPLLSVRLGGDFNGYAHDGYIRKNNPTGEKTAVLKGVYDYGSDLRTFYWGVVFGADYQFSRRWSATAEFNATTHPIFPSDYTNVSYKLRPLFATVGVGYAF